MKLSQSRQFKSLTGAVFTGEVVEELSLGPFNAVKVRVSGKAHYSGKSTFTLEHGDTIGEGFLLKQ